MRKVMWFILPIAMLLSLSAIPVSAQTHSIALAWTQSPNPNCTPTPCPVTGNKIYRGTTAGGEGTVAYATLTSPGVAFTDTAVTPGVTYFYKVTAVNINGESVMSAEVSAMVPISSAPAPPTGVTATPQ